MAVAAQLVQQSLEFFRSVLVGDVDAPSWDAVCLTAFDHVQARHFRSCLDHLLAQRRIPPTEWAPLSVCSRREVRCRLRSPWGEGGVWRRDLYRLAGA